MELSFVRDTNLIYAVEGKSGDIKISPHLRYFEERLPSPILIQVHIGEKELVASDIFVLERKEETSLPAIK